MQITGTSEFNEVFFDGARTRRRPTWSASVDDGWKVAMGTLAFERGASTLGQQLEFEQRAARGASTRAHANGAIDDPVIRQRLADAWLRLAHHAPEHACAMLSRDRHRARAARR